MKQRFRGDCEEIFNKSDKKSPTSLSLYERKGGSTKLFVVGVVRSRLQCELNLKRERNQTPNVSRTST